MSIIKINQNNFEEEVIKNEKNVLIDFYADWCGPCRMLSPIIDEIANEHPEYAICKVNVDDEPELAERFGVISIPTLVVMKGGELKERAVGGRPKEIILEMLK